jgi:hypothetical protein
MASDFPIQYYTGVERGQMNEYFTPHASAVFPIARLVVMDGDEVIDECGADPALILGISKGAAADKWLWEGRVPVSVISSQVEYGLCVGAGTLAATHVNTAVGLAKLASGNWSADLAEGSNTRFHITKVDVTNQIAWGKFISQYVQMDGIGEPDTVE